MKILHCADLHIREKDAEEINRCLQFIVDKAQEERPDVAVIAGDIFDSRDVRVDSQAARMAIGFVSALMDVCPVAIVLGTPTHDGAAPMIMQYARGTFPVIVADKPMQVILSEGGHFLRDGKMFDTFGNPLAILTLIPQPTKQYWQTQAGVAGSDQEIGAAMGGVFAGFGAEAANYPGVSHILVYHGGISGARVSTGQTLTGHDIEVSTDQLALTGAHLHLCGHIHMAQGFGDGRTFYAGSPYRTNWGEAEAKGFYVHEIKEKLAPNMGGGYPGRYAVQRFVETPCRKALRFANDFTKNGGVPSDLLNLIAPDQDITAADVRLDITVWQDEAEKIDRKAIEAAIMGAAASCDIRITRVPRETVRAASVLAADTLRAKIEERARIIGEEVPAGVLDMADLLQGSEAEKLIKMVMGGAA